MIGRDKLKKWNLKRILKEIVLAALLILILSNIISYLRSPELSSTQLPKIEVQLLDGSYFNVEKGKPLVLHFWALWCPTCKLEAPNIETISQKYRVLTVVVRSGDDEKVKDYIKKYNLSFNVVNDRDGSFAKRFNIEAFPTTFIYDSDGELQFTEVGYSTTAGLEARLRWIE